MPCLKKEGSKNMWHQICVVFSDIKNRRRRYVREASVEICRKLLKIIPFNFIPVAVTEEPRVDIYINLKYFYYMYHV